MSALAIDQIVVRERVRADLGDLSYLKESIATVGLLQPIVITKDNVLIAGERRLAAARELGMTTISVVVADGIEEASALLRAEADENIARKPFTPYEAARYRERQAELLAPLAAQRVKAGVKVEPSSKLDEGSGATRKLAAAGTGYSGTTLDKVDKIRNAAERGVVKIGAAELPIPDEVRAVAQEALADVKQTGAAVDGASKKVSEALADYLDTPGRRRDQLRLELAKGIRRAAEFTSVFDPIAAGEVMDDDAEASYRLTQSLLNKWFDTALASRPRGLAIVGK